MEDVVVIGGGLAGSAAAWRLRRLGHPVTLIEQYARHHERGSSHGGERIFRLSYRDPDYIRLGIDALTGWRELERESDRLIVHTLGMVDHGNAEEITAIEKAFDEAGVSSERLSESEATQQWPGMRAVEPVLFQADGARIDASIALDAFWDGLSARFNTSVTAIEPGDDEVTIRLDNGTELRAAAAVVAPGAWASPLLAGLVEMPPIKVTLETVAYFKSSHRSTPWPCFIHHQPHGVYGQPTPDGLVKIGGHGIGPEIDPDEKTRHTPQGMVHRLTEYAREWLPGLDPKPVRIKTCLYATTPTDDFEIKRVGRLVVLAGFGGHGFKFGPEIGRRAAELVDEAISG